MSAVLISATSRTAAYGRGRATLGNVGVASEKSVELQFELSAIIVNLALRRHALDRSHRNHR
jgi:hypothetical protein